MNKKSLNYYLIFIIAFTLFANFGFSGISHGKIDKLVKKAMNEFNVAGVAVVVVKNGKIYHIKGYGYKNLEKKQKTDENTLFAIASNSKAFTIAALSILVDEGKLTWKTKVKDIIPEFRMYNSYVTENFMIEDLLTHRSGLGLGAGDLMFFPDGSNFTIADILTVFQYFKPVSQFRTQFDYDNLLYMVAGEVIKRVSGKSWEEFVKERIFKSLDMNNSYTNFNFIKDKEIAATPYSGDSGKLIPINHYTFSIEKLNGAAGGIYSSVKDLSKWLILQMKEGKYGKGKRLFSEKNQKKMWTIHTVMQTRGGKRYNTHFMGYGLGWMLYDIKGNMMVTHTGGLPGFLSKTAIIPDIKLGIIILTNTSPGGGALFSAITNTIVDSFLGLKHKDWVKIYKERTQKKNSYAKEVVENIWKTIEKNKDKEIDLKKYIGIYSDKWFGKIEIKKTNKNLYFKSFRSSKLRGKMFYYKANTFVVKWRYRDMNADAFAIFCLGEEGDAVSLRMKGISPDIDFSFDFQDLKFRRVKKQGINEY
jgi:CubicO group peptidase (beta-lactamase class C family)